MSDKMPEIVLLPGLDGTGELFARIEKCLTPAVRVTVVRYPSDPKLRYAGYAEIVRAALGTRRVTLLAESFSGPVAVLAAAQMPEQVRGLILSATFLTSPHPGWLIRLTSGINPCNTPRGIRNRVLMGRFGDEALDRQITEIVTAMPAGVRQARLHEVSRVDVRKEFASLSCPILALHGNGDWLVPKRPLARAIRSKSNARISVMQGAHLLLQTRAAEAARIILPFMQSLESPNLRKQGS